MKELLQRTLTGLGLIVLVMGSMVLGALPFLAILLLIYILGIRELYGLFPEQALLKKILGAFPGFFLLLLSFMVLIKQWNPFLLGLAPLLWMVFTLISGFKPSAILSLFWLAIPLAAFLSLGWMEGNASYHHLLPLSVISLLWVNDTFAYLSGSLVGRRVMTPATSPGKTWEGFFGGVFFTLLGGWIMYRLAGSYSLLSCVLLALLVSILGLLGDLYESHLKRRREVKDTGNLLPGHGGILDRFDSLLFVAPGAWLLFQLIRWMQ